MSSASRMSEQCERMSEKEFSSPSPSSNRGEIKNDLGLNEIVIMTKIQPQIVSYQ